MGGVFEFGVLETWEVTLDGEAVLIRGARARQLLAYLALRAESPVSVDRLIDAIWGENPPRSARNSVQRFVSDLRRDLGPAAERLQSTPSGYQLELGPDDVVDAVSLRSRVDAGRTLLADGHHGEALGMVAPVPPPDSEPLAGLDGADFVSVERVRLEELIADATEIEVACRLTLGDTATAVERARRLVERHPYREQAVILLATGLAGLGRGDEALRELSALGARLRDELGLDPSPQVGIAESDILDHRTSREALPRTTIPPIGSIPAALNDFVGRREEVAELHHLLDAHRLVTLSGPGGTGKTRLATEAVRRIADRYVDGAWFVDLRVTADGAHLPAAIALATGLHLTGADPTTQVLDYLGNVDALLVLDNCEHLLDDVAAFLTQLLARPGTTRVLATTREYFGIDGEHLLRLDPLDVSEQGPASRLFLQRAAAAKPNADLNDVASVNALCRRLDGLPLAIELAAARSNVLTPHGLLTRIDQRFELLRDRSRSTTLESTLDWSFDLLEPREQRLLASLAVFAGTFDSAAVASVAGMSDREAIDGLESLIAKSLVIARPHGLHLRFELLETTAAYAMKKLAESGGVDDTRDRHLDHYLAASAPYAPGQPGALRRSDLDVDRANLVAALDRAEATSRWLDANRILDNAHETLVVDAPATARRMYRVRNQLGDLSADWVIDLFVMELGVHWYVEDFATFAAASAQLAATPGPRARAGSLFYQAYMTGIVDPEHGLALIEEMRAAVATLPVADHTVGLAALGDAGEALIHLVSADIESALEVSARGFERSGDPTWRSANLPLLAYAYSLALAGDTAALRPIIDLGQRHRLYDMDPAQLELVAMLVNGEPSVEFMLRNLASESATGRQSRAANDALVCIARAAMNDGEIDDARRLLDAAEMPHMPWAIPLARMLADQLGIRDQLEVRWLESQADLRASHHRGLAHLHLEMAKRGWR